MSGVIAPVAGSQETWATFGEGKTKFGETVADGWTGGARSSQKARRSFASYSRIARWGRRSEGAMRRGEQTRTLCRHLRERDGGKREGDAE